MRRFQEMECWALIFTASTQHPEVLQRVQRSCPWSQSEAKTLPEQGRTEVTPEEESHKRSRRVYEPSTLSRCLCPHQGPCACRLLTAGILWSPPPETSPLSVVPKGRVSGQLQGWCHAGPLWGFAGHGCLAQQ